MRLLLNLCAASLFLGTAATAHAEAGRIQATDGVVFISRAGVNPIIAAKGSAVASGDELETGAGASVIMKMADGQEIYLKEKTRFKIDYFKYEASQPQESKSVMNLIRGGLRSVSGLIGHMGDPAAYKMVTPKGTIGIRGTEYSAVLCDHDCANGKDGLNVYVVDGKIVLVNDAGLFSLAAGEGALIGDVRAKMITLDPAEVQHIVVPKSMRGGSDCGA